MKFIVSRDALYKNLTAINGVLASSNSTMPILENFLFTVENNTLTFGNHNVGSITVVKCRG